MRKGVQFLIFWFVMYFPDVALGYIKEVFHPFNGTFCTSFDIVQKIIASETLCAALCSRNRDILACKGFCYEETSKTCKLYCVPDLGPDSIRLTWISFVRMGVSLNYDDALTKCSDNGYGVPLPATDEERLATINFANENFRVDLNDREKSKTFKTSEGHTPESTFWMNGQPNHLAGQNCVWTAIGQNGKWNDLDCTSSVAVYCQKPKPLQCKKGVQIGAEPHRADTELCYLKSI